MNPKPLCAITGANGYVGGCFRQHFLARGWDVLELTRQPRPGARSHPFQLGGEFSPAALAGVSALVHCAYDFKPLRWPELQAVNAGGTAKLLAAAQAAGVGRIICISTISAYPGCRSLYGRVKLEIEKITLEAGGLALRPGLVYGDQPGGMFGKLVAQMRSSRIVPMIGDGSQILRMVHETDLCSFAEKYAAGTLSPPAQLYTAAHEYPWRFKNILQEIARGLGRNPVFIPLPWRLIWAGLKSVETTGCRLNFRSDSLVSLMYQNPAPELAGNLAAGLVCRPFAIETLRL